MHGFATDINLQITILSINYGYLKTVLNRMNLRISLIRIIIQRIIQVWRQNIIIIGDIEVMAMVSSMTLTLLITMI